MDIKVQTDQLAAVHTSRATEAYSRSAPGSGITGAGYGATDAVELSDLATRLAEGSAADMIRSSDRVSALSAVYAKGAHSVDAVELSRAIVKHALGVVP